ncbi:MAG TPA: IPT/TIG domain-containing protein, partial [Bryobacteraceae bacterium]|nr:IPT/TIG domain-containing protein [Bryobacteraceae bacterium]
EHRVRKVENGVITTVAGTGMYGFSGDNGPATSARLFYPADVALDSAGNLYIADSYNNRIRKVSNGVITTVAGNATQGFGGDNGPATSALLNYPTGVAVDSAGKLYIADRGNYSIRKLSDGVITTIAGDGECCFGGDNVPATKAQLFFPTQIAMDHAGNLYIADTYNHRIRKVSNGVITTVAGNGIYGFSGDGGSATGARLNSPYGVAVDSAGNLYIADTYNKRIRKVSNGVITTVAGGGSSFGDNGPATSASLNLPTGVAVDSAGNLYIADGSIREVSNGVITTLAGNGTSVAVDSAGNLYIADPSNSRIRKISNGVVTTVAGNGMFGFGGDNGPATSAQLLGPSGIAVDSIGNLYIADTGNKRIRKVSNGVITTIAGNGTPGFSGDNGPAISAQLQLENPLGTGPPGLAVDANGTIFIADSGNDRIRVLTPIATPASVAVTNAGSNLSGPIAPGEIVVMYGSGLGPDQLTQSQFGNDGLVPTQLADTAVSFNGIYAPIIYTSATQVAAVVPYVTSGTSAQVTITYQGQIPAAATVNVVSTAPALFTSDGSGVGQAAAVNPGGSTNTTATPSKIGDVIVLFATGEGQTMPAGIDGKPASTPLPKPLLPVTVNIGGQPAELQYYGGAPGEVAGVMQVNVKIPPGVSGNVPVMLRVGDASSQPGVTIAVTGN